ncbi:MAG TPA: ABC transporter permease [Solirubrobacteraceae bacterium]|nr:ABC transporter permease [Solirubrobacteraceae bacterium]
MTQPQTEPAPPGGQAPPPGAAQERRRALDAERLAQLGPLIALVLVCAFFATQSDRFLTGSNFSLVFQQVMVIGTLAIGQTIIILTAGIDLSCGVVMAFGSIVMTKMAVDNNVPPVLAILLGILACVGFGFVNGGFVTALGLPPFIVTLGTYNIAFALTHIYSNDETISTLPTAMTKLGEGFSVGGTQVTYGSLVCLALFIGAWFALSQTAWGRHVYTLGDNSEAARLMGISVRRKLLMVYVIAGAFYGVAALLLVSRTNVGDPNAGVTENLEAITAVVLGGTSLFGGRGTVIGTLIGALIIGVLRNGLVLMGVASIYQVLITGILVILAVSVDQLARRRAR